MMRLIFVSICLLVTSILFTQEKKSKGELAEYHFDYLKAVKYYQKSYSKQPNYFDAIKIARGYRALHKAKEAALWYKKAITYQDLITSDKLIYGLELTELGEYDLALYWIKKYTIDDPNNDIAKNYLHAINHLDNYYKDSSMYVIDRLKFNTRHPEFSPVGYQDGLMFLAPHQRYRIFPQKKSPITHEPYLDIFYYNFIDSTVKRVKGTMNSKYHEGPLAFCNNDTIAYFTRNNYYHHKLSQSDEDKVGLKIYRARRKEGEWRHVKEIAINSDDYSVAHPTLDSNGKLLFFTSNEPNGKGGFDLCFSKKEENGFTTIINLGDKCNTSGNEVFPHYDQKNNKLYFASDGLGGLGGFDVFEAQLDEDYHVIQVKNLGYPLNSHGDDFGLIFLKSGTGYFSSNRSGNDDIYLFARKKKEMKLSGLVVDLETKEPLPYTRISIQDDLEEVDYLITDENGYYESTVDPASCYTIHFDKVKYEHKTDTVSFEGEKLNVHMYTKLKKTSYKLKGSVSKLEDKRILSDKEVTVVLLNKTIELADTLQLNKKGEYTANLLPKTDYKVTAYKDSSFIYSEEISTHAEPEEYEINFEMRDIVLNEPIKIENIYYDYNKANLRLESEIELNKIIKLLLDNPSLIVELSSHTDSRGTNEFNLELSQKRSNAVLAYLLEKGIPKYRLSSIGYGEELLINLCIDSVPCIEDDHQINRRTEFTIVGYDNISLKNK